MYRSQQGLADPVTSRPHRWPGEDGEDRWVHLKQQHLFDPDTALSEAHHQTPAQFQADPRTWWHGRFSAQKARLSAGGTREGFHAGTEGAARKRLEANRGRRAEKPGVHGHLFPLRITGPVGEEVQKEPEAGKKTMWGKGGSIVHTALGPGGAAHEAGRGYLYENEVEGGISVGVPQRGGFMSTHREMVEAAQKRGEHVHPTIAWSVKNLPQHTGENYPQHRWEEPSPEGQRYHQPSLHEQFLGTGETSKGYALANQMFPSTPRTEHSSYETESGKTVHIRRTLGRQWEPNWGAM